MARSSVQDPFSLLREIERRSRASAAGLPRQEAPEQEWIGIGFRLGRSRLVAPLGEVLEILTYPGLTRVPGTKHWVKGIANVRGNLLPIMDLQGYLCGRRTPVGRRSRVLVVNHRGVFTGLLVDEVLGLKHFLEEHRTHELPEVDEPVRPYLKRAYRDGDGHWGVFSLFKLAENPLFLRVAV